MMESTDSVVSRLRELYLETLSRCAPGMMLRRSIDEARAVLPASPQSIVSIGKCAVPLANEAAKLTGTRHGLVIHPSGYGDEADLPSGLERVIGSHPFPSEASRIAARRAIEFVSSQRDPILFLVSGGASACMEDGFEPHVTLAELIHVNRLLLASGLAIDAINTVRRHLSAVKGGRLGALAPRGSTTLVYSDVPPRMPELVGSGPTAADPTTLVDAAAILSRLRDPLASDLASRLRAGLVPETVTNDPTTLHVIADSDAMVDVASAVCRLRGLGVKVGPTLDGDVETVARRIANEAAELDEDEVLIAAGESTVEVKGNGRGGRCTELAARFVLASDEAAGYGVCGVFGSSDGRDGNSPAAGVIVRPSASRRLDPERASEVLGRSASYELVADFGEPIIMMPTGNNLRDIAFVFRGR